MALCHNQHPETGAQLTLRQNQNGQRRVCYDFTCSAPKSVSILAVTLDDSRLITAHEPAWRIAFQELQTFAATRVRKQGMQEDRTTGTLVGAQFTHTTSRALDPQLHTFPMAHWVRCRREQIAGSEGPKIVERVVLTFSTGEATITGLNLRRIEEALCSGGLMKLQSLKGGPLPELERRAFIYSIRVALEEPR